MEKISVVTVTYNCKNFLEKTIQSILALSYPNIEYIIIDGASNDGTQDVICSYRDRLAYYVSEPDNGIYDAMNKGIDVATGDWIFFLNAGDVLCEDALKKLPFEKYLNQKDYCGIIGDVRVLYEDGVRDVFKNLVPFYRNSGKSFSMGFSHQGVFVKAVLAKHFKFDLSYKLCADFNMMMSLHKHGYKFAETDVLISIIEGGRGFSENNGFTQLYEAAKVCGKDKSIQYRIQYLRMLLKAVLCRLHLK